MGHHFFGKSDFSDLQNQIILLDIDGTLVSDTDQVIASSISEVIKSLKRQGNHLFLVTNSRTLLRNQNIANQLGVELVESNYKKPHPRAAGPALDLVKSNENELVVIGDKYLTDGLFARRLGAEFRKVKRLTSGQERIPIRLINLIDDILTVITWKPKRKS